MTLYTLAIVNNTLKIVFKMQTTASGEALGGHILSTNQFVAAFCSSGTEDFPSAGSGHAGAESDMFSSFGFIRSVCR